MRIKIIIFLFAMLLFLSCEHKLENTNVKNVMDSVVTRLYEKLSPKQLDSIDTKFMLEFLTEKEKKILSDKYWCFDISQPSIISVMRFARQKVVPFWIEEKGFEKTDMVVKNEHYEYEVWQKRFKKGKVELGINGFDKERVHYFVTIAPIDTSKEVIISNFSPEEQAVHIMDVGAFVYHDWDELTFTQVPEKLIGSKLLTTIRGRAREAHTINAFRKTPFPSTEKPDQILLTWEDSPATTQTIQWRTNSTIENSVVRYWQNEEEKKVAEASKVVVEDRMLQNDRYINRFTVTITDLTPSTKYKYQVGHPIKNIWSEEAEFITAPLDEASFSFVYFGDAHRSPHWGRLINNAYQRFPETAFYTIAGDNVSTGLYRDDWDELFEYSKDVIRFKPLMPSLGNHDSQDGLGVWMFLDLFRLPHNGPNNMEKGRTYSFNYSNALFLMIDPTYSIEKQTEWIEEQLKNTKATWKFAVFHFPPYSLDEDYFEIRDKWGKLFDKYHVDVVMSGHVHYYMRSKYINNQKIVKKPSEGTIYLTSIPIPNQKKTFEIQPWVEVFKSGKSFYQYFTIDGNKLVYKAYNEDNKEEDTFTIIK